MIGNVGVVEIIFCYHVVVKPMHKQITNQNLSKKITGVVSFVCDKRAVLCITFAFRSHHLCAFTEWIKEQKKQRTFSFDRLTSWWMDWLEFNHMNDESIIIWQSADVRLKLELTPFPRLACTLAQVTAENRLTNSQSTPDNLEHLPR